MRLHSVMACLLLVPAFVFAEDPQPKPIAPAEAAKKLNEKVTVRMLVKSTGGRSNTYLNSEADFNLESNFTIFIDKDAKEKYKKAGIENPTEYYKNKTIEVTGTVVLFEKKPRIAAAEPTQIKVIKE